MESDTIIVDESEDGTYVYDDYDTNNDDDDVDDDDGGCDDNDADDVEKLTEYGQCPNTDTFGISETINPTKKF